MLNVENKNYLYKYILYVYRYICYKKIAKFFAKGNFIKKIFIHKKPVLSQNL